MKENNPIRGGNVGPLPDPDLPLTKAQRLMAMQTLGSFCGMVEFLVCPGRKHDFRDWTTEGELNETLANRRSLAKGLLRVILWAERLLIASGVYDRATVSGDGPAEGITWDEFIEGFRGRVKEGIIRAMSGGPVAELYPIATPPRFGIYYVPGPFCDPVSKLISMLCNSQPASIIETNTPDKETP